MNECLTNLLPSEENLNLIEKVGLCWAKHWPSIADDVEGAK